MTHRSANRAHRQVLPERELGKYKILKLKLCPEGVWGPELCSVKIVWGRRSHTIFPLVLHNLDPQTSSGHNFCTILILFYFSISQPLWRSASLQLKIFPEPTSVSIRFVISAGEVCTDAWDVGIPASGHTLNLCYYLKGARTTIATCYVP